MAKMGLSPRRRACFPKRAFSTIFLKTQLSVVISLRPGHPERSKWASRLGGVRILSEEVFQRIYKVVGNPSCLGFFWLCLGGPGPLRKRPGSPKGGSEKRARGDPKDAKGRTILLFAAQLGRKFVHKSMVVLRAKRIFVGSGGHQGFLLGAKGGQPKGPGGRQTRAKSV